MNQLKIKDTVYYFEVLTGNVTDEKKNYSSNVVGGGNLRGQGLDDGKISISSTTTIHQDIVIEDKNKQLHHIKLTNWDMPCFIGNEMIFVLDASNNEIKYSVTNKTLNKTYYASILNEISEIKQKEKGGCMYGLIPWVAIVLLALMIDPDYFLGAFILGGLIGVGIVGIRDHNSQNKDRKYDNSIYQKFKSVLDDEIAKY